MPSLRVKRVDRQHCGLDVVSDWNQWSRQRRTRWHDRAGQAGYSVLLHHVDVPVETAIAGSLARTSNEPTRSDRIEPADVRYLASIFEPPTADEGIPFAEPHVFDVPGGRLPFWKEGEAVATRQAYGEALTALGAIRGDVVALDGEVPNSTHSEMFRQAHPTATSRCSSPSSR